jgi:cytochrome c oxidase cbb3-type subunit 3
VSHNGESVASEYESDMRVARAAKAQAAMGESVSETSLAALMADASMMNDANQLYAQRCAACHADKGQGLIGPNLTDNAWIHGSGTLMDIFNTVSKGVLQKGMPAWEMQLTPVQLRQITAFIGTQRGKNIAGKAPEGTVSSEL